MNRGRGEGGLPGVALEWERKQRGGILLRAGFLRGPFSGDSHGPVE